MDQPLVLASGSSIRTKLLTGANIPHEVVIPRIDEEMVKKSLRAEDATPRDVADTLAEMKARRVSDTHPDRLVLGCDQVLDHKGTLISKPDNPATAVKQLQALSDNRHMLLSAAVICEAGRPIWRHVGQVRLRMRPLSEAFIADYVTRNWNSIQHSVGCYKLEEEGVRLFSNIEGDYFNVLGMPLVELVNYLTLRGDLTS